MFAGMNERIRKLSVMDIGLIKWSVFFTSIIIVKLFPRLLNINYAVLFIFMLLCAARPFYKVWIKR